VVYEPKLACNRPELWLLCAVVVLVAIVVSLAPIAARVSGIENREASALGWLMNTRGLTELMCSTLV